MAQTTSNAHPLQGARVLVVDDEILIALDIEATLRAVGVAIIDICTTVADAMKIAREAPVQAAVLDIRIGQETSAAVADALDRRHIPFLFYSGQSMPAEMPPALQNHVVLSKPVPQADLVAAVVRLMLAV